MTFNNRLLILKNKYTLKCDEFYFRCSIGKKGLSSKKKEGDNKTPKGIFKLGNLFYRKDRVKKPNTILNCKTITNSMGWCNNPNDKKNYNELINIKKVNKYEKLFRKDYKYDYLIPIQYNTKKKEMGKGSAIFIHLTKNYKSTAGCIALKKNDFLILLRLIKKNSNININ
jgi:L,D-peptidoglycan transpeptidase YkuD (ErfK/YbiS/YcfS/YnhG family)